MYRTDIRGYYRHISKAQLKRHVERFVPEQHLRQVIHQYIDYSVEDGGEFYTPPSGIPRGCALSPFLGASFLWYVDGGFERERGLFYVRYMDDFYFCLSAAGRCAGQLAGCISTLMTQDLSVIRTKPQSVGLRRALTGWVSGLMKGGPSG
ncbi:reverse transcriptase domain-containing protein [Escherichia coli]|uniref:reverse transcriptase domain-containing protein n=1 Tax=Escherichia coli TaxID=562 RepID=UPI001FF4447A|nr:reverse transcriptase domain-containing protein [Escherichia coli]